MPTAKQRSEAVIMKRLNADCLICLMLVNGVVPDISTTSTLHEYFNQPCFPNYKGILRIIAYWCRLLKSRNTKTARATITILNKMQSMINNRFASAYKAME